MDDRLSVLPDDILCFILSFLSLRDAIKTRLISRRWRSLSPSLDVLQLDEFNLFGCKDAKKRLGEPEYQSRVVKAVDQILQSFDSNNLRTVKVHFLFEGDFALDIDRWVSSFIRMKVETVDLDFHFRSYRLYGRECYFPCHLFSSDKTAGLRHLSLFVFKSSILSGFSSQLRFLSSLMLVCVPLDQSDVNCILSNCSNLEVLKLFSSNLPQTLFVHSKSSSLKVLVIHSPQVDYVELHSPTLETFEFSGELTVFSFLHVPLLKKVYVASRCTLKLDAFAGIPQLQVLSLLVQTQAKFVRNRSSIFNSLKQMDLKLAMSGHWDPLISMDQLLAASPFLEILNLEVFSVDHPEIRQEHYNRSYPHLKEVHIKRCHAWRSQMPLVAYLLRAAVNLKRMVISVTEPLFLYPDPKPKVQDFLQNENINFTAEVIIV